MKKIFIICALAFLLVLPMITAESYGFKQGEGVNFSINTYYDNESKSTEDMDCYFTFKKPDTTVLIDDQAMIFNPGGYHSYYIDGIQTFNDSGTYSGCLRCDDGTEFGNKCVDVIINPSGKAETEAGAIFYFGTLIFLIVLLIACGIGVGKSKAPWAKLLCGYGVYIMMIAMSYMVFVITSNFLTVSNFIPTFFYWVFLILVMAFLPIFCASMAWYIWLLIKLKQIQRLINEGVPEDEAYVMAVKGGLQGIGK